MDRRDLSLLVVAAIALVAAAALLALSAALDANWIAVVAVVFIVLALIQRDRFLFGSAWRVLITGVAAAVALGFLFERLT